MKYLVIKYKIDHFCRFIKDKIMNDILVVIILTLSSSGKICIFQLLSSGTGPETNLFVTVEFVKSDWRTLK